MAGACPPQLSVAVAEAGGMGACGVLLMQPDDIAAWAVQFRAHSQGAFQLNLWIPDPAPARDAAHEAALRAFLGQWGPQVPAEAADGRPPDFAAQCAAMLEARPNAVSSIMGVYAPDFVRELKARGIAWFAVATTVAEAREAEAAGADAIVAQGMEAGGHRGSFEAGSALQRQVGLFALLPAIVDAVRVPVIAAGGIADARGVAAALMLGASATLVGTGFLRRDDSGINRAWADALAQTAPEDTVVSRVFSGRAGRCIVTDYVRAASADTAPAPAPYPVQRGLTAAMRKAAAQQGNLQRMQAWAGQSAALAQARPAGEIVHTLWTGAQAMLG
jgi:nitronate monooxygenase